MHKQLSLSEWDVLAGTVRGYSHRTVDGPRQDSFSIARNADLFAVAVADGHGSPLCLRSGEGSRIAATRSTSELPRALPLIVNQRKKDVVREFLSQGLCQIWRNGVDPWLNAFPLSGDPAYRALSPKDRERVDANPYLAYGSTLVLVGVTPSHLVCAQIGDGAVIAVDEEGIVERLLPAEGTPSPFITSSLCQSNAAEQFRVKVFETAKKPLSLILLCTDGYSEAFRTEADFFQCGTDFKRLLETRGIDYVRSHLVGWVKKKADEGTSDDATVAILCNKNLRKREVTEPCLS